MLLRVTTGDGKQEVVACKEIIERQTALGARTVIRPYKQHNLGEKEHEGEITVNDCKIEILPNPD